MGLKGSFREFSPTDIIQLIYIQKKSGRLKVRSDNEEWVLGFEDGCLVQASTGSHGMPRMGEILVRQGYLDRETLAAALAEQGERPRHLGQVLESMNVISHADIARALSFQIQETALNLFFHTDGDYIFERVPVKYDSDYITPVNTEFVLMEGARRVDEWPRIEKTVGGGDSIFSPVDDVDLAKVADLGAQECRVFDRVDGSADVGTLITSLAMGLFDTCRILSELAAKGLIHRVQSGAAPLVDPISGGNIGLTNAARSAVSSKRISRPTPQAKAVEATGHTWLWMAMGLMLLAASFGMWMTMGSPQ
jgi:hypothetical protein